MRRVEKEPGESWARCSRGRVLILLGILGTGVWVAPPRAAAAPDGSPAPPAEGSLPGPGADGSSAETPPLPPGPDRSGPDEPAPRSPGELADRVADLFVSGAPEAFESLFPGEEGRSLVRSTRRQDIALRAGPARVIQSDGNEATLLLAGYPVVGNSGDETIYSRIFSGLYRAVREEEGWRLSHRLPMDGGNRILSQSLDVVLEPGQGLRVVDNLVVEAVGPEGFWAHLNHRAHLESLTMDGGETEHYFDAGLLWVAVPRGRVARLELKYRVDLTADAEEPPNSGRFEADFGHVRHQYFWHPFFDFDAEGDRADFRVRVESPAEVQVVTGLAQVDELSGDRRVVMARSGQPTSALTLLYDRRWERHARRVGGTRIEVFAVPGFRPDPSELASQVEEAYRVLAERYGEPRSTYLAVAQARARGSGWHFRSNDMIVGGGTGATASRGGALPRAWLGHEVAHGWTRPTGPGSHFLSEGWAMLAEALLIEERFGAELLPGYWEHHRNVYERRGWDGTASIMADPHNGGIAYYKGSWILRMLRDVMGEKAFDAGLRAYMALPPGGPAGIGEFEAAMSAAAGRDLGPFLRPWLEESRIPDLRIVLEDDRIVVRQEGPVFHLPLELELVAAEGSVRRRVELSGPEAVLPTRDVGPVVDVVVDPDRRLLIRRHRGEVVTFELEDPEAASVHLLGDFSEGAIPAVQQGDRWTVDVPLSAGRYVYWWGIDGDLRFGEDLRVIDVAPREPIADPFPR
jgi:hypothetical protein